MTFTKANKTISSTLTNRAAMTMPPGVISRENGVSMPMIQ